jgi:hypothetical protein
MVEGVEAAWFRIVHFFSLGEINLSQYYAIATRIGWKGSRGCDRRINPIQE